MQNFYLLVENESSWSRSDRKGTLFGRGPFYSVRCYHPDYSISAAHRKLYHGVFPVSSGKRPCNQYIEYFYSPFFLASSLRVGNVL